MYIKSILVFWLLNLGSAFFVSAQSLRPTQVAQKQLDAYNERDLEAFLRLFSDTAKVYNFPNQLLQQGKKQIRELYGKMFEKMTDLHCTLEGRMSLGDTVIDKEYIIFEKDKPAVEIITIYKIKQEKIIEVYFIRRE